MVPLKWKTIVRKCQGNDDYVIYWGSDRNQEWPLSDVFLLFFSFKESNESGHYLLIYTEFNSSVYGPRLSLVAWFIAT